MCRWSGFGVRGGVKFTLPVKETSGINTGEGNRVENYVSSETKTGHFLRNFSTGTNKLKRALFDEKKGTLPAAGGCAPRPP